MEEDSVVIAFLHELQEIGDRTRRLLGKQLDDDLTESALDDDDGIVGPIRSVGHFDLLGGWCQAFKSFKF